MVWFYLAHIWQTYVPMLTQYTEHVQMILTRNQETTNSCVSHYKFALRSIFDGPPKVAQTNKSLSGSETETTITSNYLCLQCSQVIKESEIDAHGSQKSHRFCTFPTPVTTVT